MRRAALLVILMLALSGCTSKDKLSQSEMSTQAAQALAELPGALAAGGAISGAELTIPVDAGFGIITLPMQLQVGPPGDLLLTGSFGNPLDGTRVDVDVYCNPDMVIVVTDGIAAMDPELEDLSAELRNPRGTCMEVDGEALGAFAGLVKLLQPGTLESKQYKQLGKERFEATYRDDDADLVVEVHKRQVQRIAAVSVEGELSATFTYGDRTAIMRPVADERWPLPVEWENDSRDDGHRIDFTYGEGPIGDYSIRVYSQEVGVPCVGGPAPLAAFSLADGVQQSQAGFTMRFVDNGDGVLGDGDWAWLEHPDKLQNPWRYKVEVWDDWSDTSADSFCFVPGPSGAFVVGGLLLLAAVRRYW